jgi:hypothetical protein
MMNYSESNPLEFWDMDSEDPEGTREWAEQSERRPKSKKKSARCVS